MNNKITLSHSANNKYNDCPHMYFLHYIERIRPNVLGSPLYFGSALDEAFGHLKKPLLVDKTGITKEELEKPAQDVFLEEWDKVKDIKIKYFKSDFILDKRKDSETKKYFVFELDKSIKKYSDELKQFDPEITDHNVFLRECFEILDSRNSLDEKDQQLFDRIAWYCLREKGLLMIREYEKNIYTKLDKVYSLQEKIELDDESGNKIIGYIDAIVSLKRDPNKKVILDDKTSSKKYPDDSIDVSNQLATYCEAKGIETAAYAVVEKTIRKKNPRTRSQLLVGQVSENTYNETFDSYEKTLKGIQEKKFDKNYDSGCFFFGSKCPYFDYCRSNGSKMDGLSKK